MEIARYSYGSQEALELAIERLPFKYPMELREADMEIILRALQCLSEFGNYEAGDLLSGIYTTLDIEVI